jgi:hypothetical protein
LRKALPNLRHDLFGFLLIQDRTKSSGFYYPEEILAMIESDVSQFVKPTPKI